MQENLENTLASLVAIPSVSNDSPACHAIVELIHKELRRHDLFIQTNVNTKNPWVLATTQSTKTPDILFYAHLDVVHAATYMFQMQKNSGRLIGRGVFDMKFAAACYLEFLSSHTDTLLDLNIGFLFTTDEELGGGCMNEVIASGLRPKVVFMPDGGGNWIIEKRAKGFYAVELTATGKAAHGSRPWEGASALHRLLDALQPLREKYAQHEKDHPTLMINGIQSGHAINQIPDYAVAQIDFRCFNQNEMDEYKTLLTDIVKGHTDLTLRVLHSITTARFDETSPHVQGFLDTFQKVRGAAPVYGDSYGVSDSRFFTPLGIPCIIVEPRGGNRHANDEWLMADDLITYYELIERWIIRNAKNTLSSQKHHDPVLMQ